MARTRFTNPLDNTPQTGAPRVGNENGMQKRGRAQVGGLKPVSGLPSAGNQGNLGRNQKQNSSMLNPSATNLTEEGMYNVPTRTMQIDQREYHHGSAECVYSIRSIMETDLTNYGFFAKISEGIPLFCNVKYNMSLVEKGTGAREGRGQQLNAVIYGKIVNAALMPQDLIRVKGHYRGGVYVVTQLYSENFCQNVKINRNWKNPDKDPMKKKGPSGPVPLFLVGLVFFLALIYFALSFLTTSAGIGSVNFRSIKTVFFAALLIVIVFVGLYLNRFQIFQSKPFLIVFFLTIAVLVAKYIPGGEGLVTEIGTLIITIIGLVMIVKSIFR